ncbi:hypothetical protein BG011_005992 [Mortierella polycephala]|uniref:Uncharacterized protein n=1 Tax=Mortierella polycephala TaxID=41804 RepID=A0A9P6TZL4_9FUNG|nr:hypothetical protein BG011_005992 [Mortierella polycephala]
MAEIVNNNELPDHDKMSNAPRDEYDYSTAPPAPSMHPLALYQSAPNTNNTIINTNTNLVQNAAYHPTATTATISTPPKTNFSDMNRDNALVTGYGPLDYGYGMTPTATTYNANDVNMAPFMDSNVNSRGRRHSSVGEFFSGLMGRDDNNIYNCRMSRSRTRDNSTTHTRRRNSITKFFSPGKEEHAHESLGRRRSSTYLSMGFKTDTGGDEHKGPYADVSRSQAQHMERVRETEHNLGLTHNADGLPLPKENTGQRRRSSVAHILGFDKKLLAF